MINEDIIYKMDRKNCMALCQLSITHHCLHLIDIMSRKVIKALHHKYLPLLFEFDEIKNLAYVCCQNGILVIWNMELLVVDPDPHPDPWKVLSIPSVKYKMTKNSSLLLSEQTENNHLLLYDIATKV